jgi:uncharacterized SAM-binding protein YcdF (DUF218 family)
MVPKKEAENTKAALFNRSPDLIVVYTGDKGRIPFAIKKAKEYQQNRIFISGVYKQNTVDILTSTLNNSDNVDFNQWDIDYEAQNTFENVTETVKYLKENPTLHNILIISHDYHILRIRTLIESRAEIASDINFYYDGPKADYYKFENLKKLLMESYKLLRTYLFLFFY